MAEQFRYDFNLAEQIEMKMKNSSEGINDVTTEFQAVMSDLMECWNDESSPLFAELGQELIGHLRQNNQRLENMTELLRGRTEEIRQMEQDNMNKIVRD